MKWRVQLARRCLGAIAAALLLLLSAFTFPSPTGHASGKAHSQALMYLSTHQVSHVVLPGQELVIPAPIKSDLHFTIHLKVSRGVSASPADVRAYQHDGLLLTPNTSCLNGIWAEEDGYNAFNAVIWSYRVTVNFCYNGSIVTYITTPPYESVYTIIGWSMSHHAYSTEHRTWALGHGDYTASTIFQSHSGYAEVDVYGDGSFYGHAD